MIKGEVVDKYIIRHTQKQKHEFLEYVIDEFENMEYEVEKQKSRTVGIPNYNLVIGNIEDAEIICTAHYDTPNTTIGGVKIYPNSFMKTMQSQIKIIITFSIIIFFIENNLVWILGLALISFTFTNKKNYNDNTSGVLTVYNIANKLKSSKDLKVAFILFDNEEKGLLGSSALAKKYKKIIDDKLIINFDCVGYGEYILVGAKKNNIYIAEDICKTSNVNRKVEAYIKKNSLVKSDDHNFKKSIQIMAFTKEKDDLVLNYIHTNKDTMLEEENIECITDMIVKYIKRI